MSIIVLFQNNQLSSTKSLEIELQETKQKLAEQKQITSELNVIKKHSQKLQAQLDALQTEYEAEKKTSAQTLESYMAKCTNAEQKLLEAQQTIEHLESTLVLLKNNNEKSLMDIEGTYDKKICKIRYIFSMYLNVQKLYIIIYVFRVLEQKI